MGTSNRYGGPAGNNPLIPTWLNLPSNPLPPSDGASSPPADGTPVPKDGTKIPSPSDSLTAPAGSSNRFRSSRSNFTRFVRSGGRDGNSLRRSLGDYVSFATGGSKNAAMRMGSSRRAAGTLVNFLSSAQTQGFSTALQTLNFGNLVGKDVQDVFLGLVDYICPDGGNIDEGIARSAFIETIADLAEMGVTNIDSLTPDQIQSVFELFATHTIENRLCNDIGTKICISAENLTDFERIQDQLHDFIFRSVSDATQSKGFDLNNITAGQANAIVDEIYETAFNIIQNYADQEADNK